MNKKITVSAEVAAAVAASKKSADELLREVLEVEKCSFKARHGVTLPEGTALMSWYKDRAYYASIKDGSIEIMNEKYDSPSAAAEKVTGCHVNGWTFWHCKMPGKRNFVPLANLRSEK